MGENGVWQPTQSIACKGNIVVDIVTDISIGLKSQPDSKQTAAKTHCWDIYDNISIIIAPPLGESFLKGVKTNFTGCTLCIDSLPLRSLRLTCSHPCSDICSLCRLLTTHSSCANAYNIYQGLKTAPALHKHKENIQTLLGQYVTVANIANTT